MVKSFGFKHRKQGDSVLFVEESKKTLAKVCKDGTGEVKHYLLPIADHDSIVGGSIDGDSIYLTLFDLEGGFEDYDDNQEKMRICQISLTTFDYTINTLIPDETEETMEDSIKSIIDFFNCYGNYKSMYLYYRYEKELISTGEIALLSEDGHLVSKSILKGLPPTPTFCGTSEYEGDFYSGNLFRIKNFHFFLSGYDPDLGTMSILEYNILPLYETVR